MKVFVREPVSNYSMHTLSLIFYSAGHLRDLILTEFLKQVITVLLKMCTIFFVKFV